MNLTKTLSTLAAITLVLTSSAARADCGLLVIAHGSPSKKSNDLIFNMTARMKATGKVNGYSRVTAAFMENGTPDIATAARELQAAGCNAVTAVPVFVAPSSHTHFDVPAVLGIYQSPQTDRVLKQEKIDKANLNIPITLLSTMGQSDLLTTFSVNQTKRLSSDPTNEAVVLLLHGDPNHNGIIDDICRRAAAGVAAATGISYVDWASIKVGQGFSDTGASVINKALEQRKRVLVIGLFAGISAQTIAKRAQGMPMSDESNTTAVATTFKSLPWTQDQVAFSTTCIGETDEAVQWMADMAADALKNSHSESCKH